VRGARATGAAVLLAALAFGLLAPVSPAAARPGDAPLTIPTLRQWLPGDGSWKLGEHARVLVWPSRPAMVSLARQLASDLRRETHQTVPVVVDRHGARAGDIQLLRNDGLRHRLGGEG
jgi:hypothetical protein